VNNLHIITLYKLHNKLKLRVERVETNVSSVTSASSQSSSFDKLDTAKMHGLDTSNVSSRVESRRDELSGIWAVLFNATTVLTPAFSITVWVSSAVPGVDYRFQ